MSLTKKQLEWVKGNVVDLMIDKDFLKINKAYIITVYINPLSALLVITVGLPDQPTEHIILDYVRKLIRSDCDSINYFDEYIKLDSNLFDIKFTVNSELTTVINNVIRAE